MKLSLLLSALVTKLVAAQVPIYNDTTWAGGVIERQNNTNIANFTSASAILVIPSLNLPQKPPQIVDEYTVYFWVGLDGWPDENGPAYRALWQTGVMGSIFPNGTTQWSAFYEWIPEDPIHISPTELTINTGDHISMSVSTTNDGLNGTVTLTNENTTQAFSLERTSPVTWRGPTWFTPGYSAEWIAEAGTYLNSTRVVLPDWGNATFLAAQACTTDGVCVGPMGETSTVAQIVEEDVSILYTKTVLGEDFVTVQYVEESV